MRPVSAHMRNGRADRRCNLSLHRRIPCVNSWETIIKRANKGIDPIRQKWPPVGPEALRFRACRIGDGVAVTCGESRRWIQSDRPGRQEKGSVEVLSVTRICLLAGQDRQVLSNGMAEDGPENANVIAATIAQPDHSLLVPLICDT